MSVWASALNQASYGGIEIDCVATRDSISRAIARRVYPRRDGGHLQDMGSQPRQTEVEILFFERDPIAGENFFRSSQDHLTRFAFFFEATQKGVPQDFVHPITGTYRALVEDLSFDANAEDEDQIRCTCTFVEDTTEPAVFSPGYSFPLDAGTAAVQVQVEQLEEDLSVLGLSSPIPDLALELAELWASSPFITLREINLQLASAASSIDTAIADLELVTTRGRYPIWRSMQRLLYSLRMVAESFRQSQPQLTIITVLRGQPLRALVTEFYGAASCEQRMGEISRLNDIDDPSYIREGIRLRAPIADVGRKQVLRRVA